MVDMYILVDQQNATSVKPIKGFVHVTLTMVNVKYMANWTRVNSPREGKSECPSGGYYELLSAEDLG